MEIPEINPYNMTNDFQQEFQNHLLGEKMVSSTNSAGTMEYLHAKG